MNPAAYLGLVLLILVLVSYPVWRPFVMRKATAVGEQAGRNFAAKRLPGALEALATTLEIDADPATSTALIDQAVAAKPKKAANVGAGVWYVKFTEMDDIHVRLAERPGGTVLGVVKTLEFQEFPQGGADWKAFRGRIVDAAQSAGVTVREGSGPEVQRALRPDGKHDWVVPG